MGRPREENPLINATKKKCKWREKNQYKDLKQKREAYAQKQQTISTEELKIQQEVAHVRKILQGWQKLQGMKLKDQNRKQKEQEEKRKTPEETSTKASTSTKAPWNSNIKFDFKKGNSQLNKTEDQRRGFIIRISWEKGCCLNINCK